MCIRDRYQRRVREFVTQSFPTATWQTGDPWITASGMQSLRSGPFSSRVFNSDPLIEVVVTEEAQGDCMYVSIVRAIESLGDLGGAPCNVESLRAAVALAATQDMLQQYQQDSINGLTHTEFMEGVESLGDLQQCIRHPRKVWGDSHSLASVATAHGLVFLLWSEPLVPLRRFNAGYPFVAIPAPPVVSSDENLRYVMLQHTRREHYNLIMYNGQGVFPYKDLPAVIKQRWWHVWSVDGKTASPEVVAPPKPKRAPVSPAKACGRFKHNPDCQCHIKHLLRAQENDANGTVAPPPTKKQKKLKVRLNEVKTDKPTKPAKPVAKACGRMNHSATCRCHVKHRYSSSNF
eukprot:TRINITY_DN2212_c0_g1_i4.p1 TRINITY_DN2212_c0_g1~~TRINITY_DN2212_c0_g1_i4.p1  ORF type:complete len:347 (-),score=52.89 TRINITY_DN2212_c0_g1_i4:115-1155(-)